MSFHPGRGCPRGRGASGQRGTPHNYRPQNLRPIALPQPMPPFHYDPQAALSPGYSNSGSAGYMPPRPDFIPYPPPMPPLGQNPTNKCPLRPQFPNPPVRQAFPGPPNFPPPPILNPTNSSLSGSAASGQSTYHYMMPPPPLPHTPVPPSMPQKMSYQPPYSINYSQLPFPPPNFNAGYQQHSSSFNTDQFRHASQYKAEKSQSERRSPERNRRSEEPRHKGYTYGSHGDRHRMDCSGERRDRDESSSDSECESDGGSSCSSSSSDSDVFDVIAEIKRKKAHPDRLQEELWYNERGQMNDGPLCKCSAKARRTGIRHSIYPGEEHVKACRLMTNNAGRLYHYRITVSPPTNFLKPSSVRIDQLDREQFNPDVITFPIIVHFGIRPAQLSYAGDPHITTTTPTAVKSLSIAVYFYKHLFNFCSVHLYLFPSLEEGGLATYRTAIVQNQHLAMLAKKLELDRFMLYARGPDLCRESDLRHAMANCFEALIGNIMCFHVSKP
ncbi:UNVERIFIED_CONTAM: hypothetical protein FKN15_051102 [Acipenser sinensis]